MKFIQPVIIKKTPEDKYRADFLDLADCHAEADSIDEVMEAANEAACTWIELELDEGNALPPVTDLHDVKLAEGEIVRNVCANLRLMDGWDE